MGLVAELVWDLRRVVNRAAVEGRPLSPDERAEVVRLAEAIRRAVEGGARAGVKRPGRNKRAA